MCNQTNTAIVIAISSVPLLEQDGDDDISPQRRYVSIFERLLL